MQLPVYNQNGSKKDTITVSDRLFGAKANADVVYQVATSQMSNMRQVLAHTKTRSEVRGGGKKPWRQKGTGRARHGSIRSPIWVGGGVAHGPSKDVNFKKKINRAQARAALAAVLSARVAEGHFVVVNDLAVPSAKTKDAVAKIKEVTKALPEYRANARILLVLPGTKDDIPLRRAVGNLAYVEAIRAQDVNTLTVLSFPYVLVAQEAVAVLEKVFGSK